MRRRRLLSAVPVAAVLALTGCSGSSSPAAEDPAVTLAAAKAKLEAAKFVAFTLTSKDVPGDRNGVTAADGVGEIDPTTPKFKGTFTGRIGGIGGTIGLLTVGDEVFIKFFNDAYKPFDLASAGAPNPSDLFSPSTGLSSILGKTTTLAFGARAREGKDVLREITGTLPGSEISRLFKLGDGTKDFQITYGVTEDGELRRTTTVGEFYPGVTSTYVIVLKDYGKAVEITRP